jgi:hypothetical protein
MLTRRKFAAFAPCALCGISEFVATAASAQGGSPSPAGGVGRKILSQTDGPMPGYDPARGSDHRAGSHCWAAYASGG